MHRIPSVLQQPDEGPGGTHLHATELLDEELDQVFGGLERIRLPEPRAGVAVTQGPPDSPEAWE